MYPSITTRPDITHAVSYLSQFNSCCGKNTGLLQNKLNIYKGTKQLISKDKPLIEAADADWAVVKTEC